MLDELSVEGVRSEMSRGRESAFNIAAADLGFAEQVAFLVQLGRAGQQCRFAVADGLPNLVVDADGLGRTTGSSAVDGGDCRYDIPDVAGLFALGHEDGPVLVYQALVSLPGHVGGGHDRDYTRNGKCRGCVNPVDECARVL